MIKITIHTLAVTVILVAGVAASLQEPSKQQRPALQAFEHYDAVRAALATDKLAPVAAHAKQLAEHAEQLGGADAKKAADALAAAKSLEDARKHFGDLSAILVPVFQAEAIPGAFAFICSMKEKTWIQKGDKVANPYYGRKMRTCGSPLPPTK